jgi:hypothetical protein
LVSMSGCSAPRFFFPSPALQLTFVPLSSIVPIGTLAITCNGVERPLELQRLQRVRTCSSAQHIQAEDSHRRLPSSRGFRINKHLIELGIPSPLTPSLFLP